jgi:hypothetical protein
MGVAVSPEVGATLTNVGAVVALESTIPYSLHSRVEARTLPGGVPI